MAPPARASGANPALVPWILYGALYWSTGMYLLVLHLQAEALRRAEPDPIMLPALGGVALVCAVMSFVLPRLVHRAALARLELAVEEVPDPNGSVMFRDRTPTLRVFAHPDQARRRARQIFFTPFILRLAIAESIAIDGFILRMQGFEWAQILPFFVVCWVIFALSAPLNRRIFGPLEKHFDARFPQA